MHVVFDSLNNLDGPKTGCLKFGKFHGYHHMAELLAKIAYTVLLSYSVFCSKRFSYI